MATKICIIDVDLGSSVDDIVAECISELTDNTRAQLTSAIESAKLNQQVKTEREQAEQLAQNKITTNLEAAYNALIAAGENGLAVSSIIAIVSEITTNPGSFTQRMKKYLSDRGNPYYLERKKVHGTPHYVLVQFHGEISEDD